MTAFPGMIHCTGKAQTSLGCTADLTVSGGTVNNRKGRVVQILLVVAALSVTKDVR